jgi:GAF domain-containing protein
MILEHNAWRLPISIFFAFRCRDLETLLTRAAELISEALQIELVKVLEHRPGHGDFLIRAGVNWAPGVVGRVTFADHEKSPAGYALLTGEPVVSRDVDAETRFEIPDILVRHGVKSMINVIIAGEEAPFGVLESMRGGFATSARMNSRS